MIPGFRILPMPQRPSRALVAALAEMVTPHLSDNMSRLRAAAALLRPLHRGGKLAGPAFTVKVAPGDNLMVHKAIDIAEPGDVIVVDAGGVLEHAIIGEIMASWAAKRGVAGIVIDGAIRDLGAISAGAFPVYARGVTHRGPYKNGPGEINVPISVGGMVVQAADIIVGDEDGLIAVPQADAEVVLAAAREQKKKEDATLKAIATGAIDRKWVDETLRARGCTV
ncbi:MAG TPA: RraA family protein [Burkholderiales bacterium]|nr:RraA family protein [Burkholderiales bacterium]